jgi:hypothetical protein
MPAKRKLYMDTSILGFALHKDDPDGWCQCHQPAGQAGGNFSLPTQGGNSTMKNGTLTFPCLNCGQDTGCVNRLTCEDCRKPGIQPFQPGVPAPNPADKKKEQA